MCAMLADTALLALAVVGLVGYGLARATEE